MKQAICKYCGKPAGPALKNAIISHGACLYEVLAEVRKRIPDDYGKKNVASTKTKPKI